ncbi:peptidylprolyl isomerase [Mariniflexile ostreae]|uniref:Peptidylprolyl isomerase n=1 Tax=Mariniflexile ostreae TaxID=1520892 RepID=A0ABV5F806_9FLAO
MLKNLLTISFLSLCVAITAQTATENELKMIETPEEIESFLKTKNSKKNKLITFNEEKHKTTLAKTLFKLSKGGITTTQNEFQKTLYKVVEKTKTLYYRVSYITLNGENMDIDDMEAIQSNIIKKYNDGASFDFLAKQYSIDENANRGGDSGWFTIDEDASEFKNSISNSAHDLGAIFTIDLPTNNMHYVVLKTFEPTSISEIKVLKIVEPLY